MKELIFVLKVFGISLVFVILMQVKVGDLTLEERASIVIQDSWVTEQIQYVGDGFQKLMAQLTGDLGKKLSGLVRKESPEKRGSFKLDRSETYKAGEQAKVSTSQDNGNEIAENSEEAVP